MLEEYREKYVRHRRAFSTEVIERAKASGEFRGDTDPDVLIDMIYGPIYYRLLIGHKPLDNAYGSKIVDEALVRVKLP